MHNKNIGATYFMGKISSMINEKIFIFRDFVQSELTIKQQSQTERLTEIILCVY